MPRLIHLVLLNLPRINGQPGVPRRDPAVIAPHLIAGAGLYIKGYGEANDTLILLLLLLLTALNGQRVPRQINNTCALWVV
jgi:hypothetical protein